MKIIELEKNMYVYSVPACFKNGLGQNICVLIDGCEALIIDTGYPDELYPVLNDLSLKGICVVKVLPSHFHPDHIDGISLIDNPVIFGNKYAVETLARFYTPDSFDSMLPDIVVDDELKVKFGNFEITFEHAPGHSDCSMLIFINNKYIHLGDLFIRDSEGNEVLPYVKWKSVGEHIASLNKILKHEGKTYLISHGPCPVEINDLKIGIENRKKYLQALIDSDNKILAADAVKDCSRIFQRMQWREDVK